MTEQTLDGHLSTPVTFDLCLSCQAFWFDGYESLKLSPGSVLRLFTLIGEQPRSTPAAPPATSQCPRCSAGLVVTHDRQRDTRFQYLRCPNRHGRLTTFFNFLREKNFIRPLSPDQIEALRRHIQVVNCSNCGAPVDVARGAACAHCASPLSMIDMGQARALVETLRTAEAASGAVDPTWPLQRIRAAREVEAAFASFDRGDRWFDDVAGAGLVGAGLRAIATWLKPPG
jgi:hypothetical protein